MSHDVRQIVGCRVSYFKANSELDYEFNSELGSERDGELGSDASSELGSEADGELGSDASSEPRSKLDSELSSELGSKAKENIPCCLVVAVWGQLESEASAKSRLDLVYIGPGRACLLISPRNSEQTLIRVASANRLCDEFRNRRRKECDMTFSSSVIVVCQAAANCCLRTTNQSAWSKSCELG